MSQVFQFFFVALPCDGIVFYFSMDILSKLNFMTTMALNALTSTVNLIFLLSHNVPSMRCIYSVGLKKYKI